MHIYLKNEEKLLLWYVALVTHPLWGLDYYICGQDLFGRSPGGLRDMPVGIAITEVFHNI